MSHDHFKGKTAVKHVAEAQARAVIAAAEIHGTETPGSISSATDAARSLTVLLLLLVGLLHYWQFPNDKVFLSLILASTGWLIWVAGRSGWLGWARLERLHRILEEERWEIEHNREQEREELRALYEAKGFEGKLLDEVMHVLMADGDRLLKIMVEEELGLSLESDEHPLKQSLGAALGALFTATTLLGAYLFWQSFGLYFASFFTLTISSAISAYYQGNRLISTIVWNLAIAALAAASTYFLSLFFYDLGLVS